MAPLRGIRYNAEHVRLGGVLAPPYDVISDAQREQLYAHDLRNIVRIDYCRPEPADVPGVIDRYIRAAQHLDSWLSLGILLRDERPAIYVYDHEFTAADGEMRRRRGLFARLPARPWEAGEILPHEHTLRGPKADRLALMRATAMQTSAVFGLWRDAPDLEGAIAAATTATAPVLGGRTEGEQGAEKHLLWVIDEPTALRTIVAALRPARLYVADGHHRYETAVAYAQERRAAEPDAPDDADFGQVLVYLCAADDPAVEVLPTHRIVRADEGIPTTLAELARRLGDAFTFDECRDSRSAVERIAALRDTDHAFGIIASDGIAIVRAPRRSDGSPRGHLDVVVLQEAILGPACGITAEGITNGALTYTRSPADVGSAVRSGEAAFGVLVNGCTAGELMAVSDAGEVMPQKSTYFSPKVPTGLILSPL